MWSLANCESVYAQYLRAVVQIHCVILGVAKLV